MSLDDWLQSGKWASGRGSQAAGAAGRALEGVGGVFERGRKRAKPVAEKGKARLQGAYGKLDVQERVGAAKERAGVVRDRATSAAETALRFVKEKPAARIARTGVQIKAGLTGFGAGYLFPDVEVLFLGIGGRGRWLAQSGVPVWGAERLARYLLQEKAGAQAAAGKGGRWQARKELYGTVAAPLLTGFSAGLGLRLVQDALNVQGLPGIGRIIIGGRAMVLERIWMLGNGIWCFAMGKDLLMVTLGRSQNQSLSDMLRRLRDEQDDADGQ